MGREIYSTVQLKSMLDACRKGGNNEMIEDIKKILAGRKEDDVCALDQAKQ